LTGEQRDRTDVAAVGLQTPPLRIRAEKMGISDINRKFRLQDMASADVVFSATGVTDGSLLKGVRIRGDFAETETVVMRSKTGTVRRIKSTLRNVGARFI
jgi:fructose-1,6-bisphosphatase II / sedoheptulose-1,7-bisphosphatase